MEVMESQCRSLSRPKSSILDSSSKMTILAPIMAWMVITTRTMETSIGIRTSTETARRITIKEVVSKTTTSTATDTNTTTKTTKVEVVNGRTTISNRCITTTSSRWITVLSIPIKLSTSHFIQIRTSRIQCRTRCKTTVRFTLGQTPMPIAFIHDKFSTVISSNRTSNKSKQLLVALDKCPPMVSIFQLMVPVALVLLVLLHRLSNQSVKNRATLKLRHQWTPLTSQNGDPAAARSTQTWLMLSLGSQRLPLLNERVEWKSWKIRFLQRSHH